MKRLLPVIAWGALAGAAICDVLIVRGYYHHQPYTDQACRKFAEHFQVYDAYTESLLIQDGKAATSDSNLRTLRLLWEALVKESISCYGAHDPV